MPDYPDWKAALADAVTDPIDLCRLLGLSVEACGLSEVAAGEFPVLVPKPYLARIRPGDPKDPLLLQVLPSERETLSASGFGKDPLDEVGQSQKAGLLWKYENRLLMVTTGTCAVHCRFCFRRHFAYPAVELVGSKNLDLMIAQIAEEPSLHEVVLSGGDPLTMDDAMLEHLCRRLADVPHLRRLRIHTRLPVLIPQRVTESLTCLLRTTRLAASLVVHINHPNEIDPAVARAFAALVDSGIPVLSQSVLLRDVNDDVEVLAELFERLVDRRVMPYYLHQLDRVAGASHFEVPVERGRELISQVRRRLPGYAVPRYVQEVPGEPNKVVLA